MKKILTLFAYSGKIITTLSSPQLSKEEEKQLIAEWSTSEVHVWTCELKSVMFTCYILGKSCLSRDGLVW